MVKHGFLRIGDGKVHILFDGNTWGLPFIWTIPFKTELGLLDKLSKLGFKIYPNGDYKYFLKIKESRLLGCTDILTEMESSND